MAEGKRVGSIYIDLGVKAATFESGLKKAENAVKSFGARVRSGLGAIKNFVFSWKTFIVGAIAGAFTAAVIGKAIGGLKTLVSGVIAASSTYEQLRMTLKVLLKDQDKANAAFDEARDLAAKTAFSIEEITRGYTQLLTFGFDQTKIPETLLLAADAATAFGQNLDEVIRSINYLKAGRKGEALESLARFGITRPELVKRGAEFSAGGELKTDTEKTLQLIFDIWKEKVGGMSEEGTKTWVGMVSNFKDAWTDFQAMIGEAGLFDAIKEKLAWILAKIKEWSDNGQLKIWADDISGYLTKTFNSLILVMSKIFGFKLKAPEAPEAPAMDDRQIKELERNYEAAKKFAEDNNIAYEITLERYKEIYGATKEVASETEKLMTLEENYNQMKKVYAENNLEMALSLEQYKGIYEDTLAVTKEEIKPNVSDDVFPLAQRIADSIGEGSVMDKITDALVALFTDPAVTEAATRFGLGVGEAFAKGVIDGIKKYEGVEYDPKTDPIKWLLFSGGAGILYAEFDMDMSGVKIVGTPQSNDFWGAILGSDYDDSMKRMQKK